MGAVPGCSWGRGALHHNVPMQVLDADATRRLLPSAPLIAALRAKFIAGCEAPLRHTHAIGAGQDASAEVAGVPIGRGTEAAQAGTLLLMPAWQPGRFLGIQTASIFPGHAALGLPGPAFGLSAARRAHGCTVVAIGRQRDHLTPHCCSLGFGGFVSGARRRGPAKLRSLVVPQEPEVTAQAVAPAECEANCAHHRAVRQSWARLLRRVLATT